MEVCDDPGYVGLPSNLAARVRAILTDVEPEPAPVGVTIDREALRLLLEEPHYVLLNVERENLTDAILALVRPLVGIVLSPEDAVLARQGARILAGLNERVPGALSTERAKAYRGLWERLEKEAGQ